MKAISLILAITALGWSSPAGAADPDIAVPKGDPEIGRELFAEHCSRCHKDRKLADKLFGKAKEVKVAEVCRFLKTHGLSDHSQNCGDVLVYLKGLTSAAP